MSKTRYSRQVLLKEIGTQGQEAFRRARVLCIGAGGLGCPAAQYLAAAGIGTLGLIDPDRVDESNLHRQILFGTRDLGFFKAEAAAARLRELNPEINVRAHVDRLSARNAQSVLSQYDILIDGTDNFASKYLINDAAVKLGLPVVFGSISQFEGRASVFWAKEGPCYRCLHPHPPKAAIQNCAEAGIIGAVAGVIGGIQAMEALKLALGALRPPSLRLLLGELCVVDCGSLSFSSFGIRKNPACPVCAGAPESIELVDEPLLCAATTDPQSLEIPEVTAEELGHASTPGTVFIDVRERSEWRLGHIPGALNWPLSELRAGEEFPLPEPPSRIVLYCQAGIRSREALRLLNSGAARLDASAPGYYSDRLCHLRNGILSWNGPLAR
ncbi:MAG: ThiF family adenylyltransferase [Oligoflexia bacterium]|nr:ThiF family adenylyltransferase [Oligoflexia bacterium]